MPCPGAAELADRRDGRVSPLAYTPGGGGSLWGVTACASSRGAAPRTPHSGRHSASPGRWQAVTWSRPSCTPPPRACQVPEVSISSAHAQPHPQCPGPCGFSSTAMGSLSVGGGCLPRPSGSVTDTQQKTAAGKDMWLCRRGHPLQGTVGCLCRAPEAQRRGGAGSPAQGLTRTRRAMWGWRAA